MSRRNLIAGIYKCMRPIKQQSALAFVLKAMIPYSRENLLLGFKPSQFFRELEEISNYKRRTLEAAARRAEERGLIEMDRQQKLRLTELGKRYALPFTAKKFKDSRLLVVFDIAEDINGTRRKFRKLLINWQFEPIQKSVWASDYDHRESIKLAIEELKINDSVKIFEARPLD